MVKNETAMAKDAHNFIFGDGICVSAGYLRAQALRLTT
jgi:hypothetical protein